MAAAGKFFEDRAGAASFADFLREQSLGLFRAPWTPAGSAPPYAMPAFEIPALGLTRDHQQRSQRAAAAAARMAEAERRLWLLWSDALREAASEFAARGDGSAPTATSMEELHALYDAWIDCAEDAYARVAHGDAFSTALAEFINAGSEWRSEMQAHFERLAQAFDLPTRSELNTLGARLKEVEGQLRGPRRKARPRTKPRRKSP